jgi:integrase/recombinase XerD
MTRFNKPDLAVFLQAFFIERLQRQRWASPNTVAAYRDTFRLLLRFAEAHLGRGPDTLSVADIEPSLISAFLDHIETERGNAPRTRNLRLAAIHSFFRYIAREEPTHGAIAQRVLALPPKRVFRRAIDFLSEQETAILLSAPDLQTWSGRRDRSLLLLAVQTGLRVSELIALRIQDINLGPGAHVRCHGKGRKDRSTPLRRDVVRALRGWMSEHRGEPTAPLFPNAQGSFLTRDGVAYLLAKHTRTAARTCASLRCKRVTPHVLRHTAAMSLMHFGVDRSVIALWLGHESVETTEMYLHADLSIKERALSKTAPTRVGRSRYRPGVQLLDFLDNL